MYYGDDMVEDFINGTLYIKITQEDILYLDELQEITGLCWSSGANLNSQITKRYFVMTESTAIYISNEGHNGIMFTDRAPQVDRWVTLSQILSENVRRLEVSEDDILNVLE